MNLHPSLHPARAAFGALLLSLAAVAFAAPSGGPYGPQARRYELPAGAGKVHFVAPDGRAEADGTSLATPTTLGAALARANSGDAVVLRGGVYRTGNLMLNQGIVIQPYADERPIIKGTEVAKDWVALRNGLWRTAWTKLFPARPADWWRREREGMRTPLHRFNNDMVFVDGKPLQSAGWEGEVGPGSFYIDYENGQVYIGVDPAQRLVEITAFDGALSRVTGEVHGKKSDQKGYTLRGLTFTQYAYRALEVEGREPEGPADPTTFGKDVVGTTLEDCEITHCSRVAGYFRGDGFTLRRCRVSDTSTEGIYLLSGSDGLIEKCVFARNNVEKITGYYPAAVKIFNQTHRVVCRDNLVMEQPDSNGIWYDVGNVDGVFVDNWVQDCQDGFFYEISQRAIVAGNVFVNCENGVRSLNSSEVRVYHNTFVDSPATFERDGRSAVGDHFGWHPATGPAVDQRDRHVLLGNLFVARPGYAKPLLRAEQGKTLAGQLTRAQLSAADDNVYIRLASANCEPLVRWAPAEGEGAATTFDSPEALRAKFPQFETRSRYLPDLAGPVFRSLELGKYELVRDLSGPKPAAALPDEAVKLLGKTDTTAAPGAYPLAR